MTTSSRFPRIWARCLHSNTATLSQKCRLVKLCRAAIAARHHEMSRAVEQTDRVRRVFVQNGYARIVEQLWNNNAFGQPRMSPDEGTADQAMRHDHQRAVHIAARAHDEVERIRDARVKCRPVFA